MNERHDSIEKRLESLEARCRRLRVWCACVTGLLLVACTAAALAPQEKTMRAERFEVIGKDGQVLAVLGEVLLPGGAGLQIGSPEGERAFALFGVFPSQDPATGKAGTGALLHLDSGRGADRNTFVAHVHDGGGAQYLANDSRSIGSYIEPGSSRLKMTTGEDHTRYEVLIEGDQLVRQP